MVAGHAFSNGQLQSVIHALDERYGISVSRLTRLGGELDANFSVETETGDRWFVRITPPPIDLGAINWQNTVLEQLSLRPLSVAVPRLVPQLDGAVMSQLGEGEDAPMLRVTSWVPGSTVSDFGATSSGFRAQLGELAAEVIESLSPLNSEHEDQNIHHWMVVKAGDSLRSTMEAVTEPGRRAMLEQAADRFETVVEHVSTLPRTVVHQDLHDFNLLAERSPGGDARISGIVDFNDAVYTARVAELAVAAAYAGLRQPDAFEAFVQVVEGFLSREELSDVEFELLYPLAVARLAVNASTWAARAKHGNTAYASSRTEATWPALEQLLRVETEQAAARFRAIRSSDDGVEQRALRRP